MNKKHIVLRIGYIYIGACSMCLLFTYLFGVFYSLSNGMMSNNMIAMIPINMFGEVYIELPMLIIGIPFMVYSLMDIRTRLLNPISNRGV